MTLARDPVISCCSTHSWTSPVIMYYVLPRRWKLHIFCVRVFDDCSGYCAMWMTSPCYRCETDVSPTRILPPTQHQRQTRNCHQCTAPDCAGNPRAPPLGRRPHYVRGAVAYPQGDVSPDFTPRGQSCKSFAPPPHFFHTQWCNSGFCKPKSRLTGFCGNSVCCLCILLT